MELHLYDLPSDLLESTGQDLTLYSYDDKTMIRSGDMLVNIQKDGHLYKLNSYLVHKYRTLNHAELKLSSYVESCCRKLEQYVDYLFAGNTYESPKLDMMNHLVKNIMNIVIHKYHLETFSNNEISVLVHFMNDYMQNYASINQLRICCIVNTDWNMILSVISGSWSVMR